MLDAADVDRDGLQPLAHAASGSDERGFRDRGLSEGSLTYVESEIFARGRRPKRCTQTASCRARTVQ